MDAPPDNSSDDGTSTSNDSVRFDSSSNDHDSIIQGSVCFFKILNGSTSKDHSGSFSVGTFGEHVISFITKLNFFEKTATSENIVGQTVDSGLKNGSSSFGNSL